MESISNTTTKHKYYIEWWTLGNDQNDIEVCEFHTPSLRHFINTFKKHKHLSLVFLERCHDNKVLYDKRAGAR